MEIQELFNKNCTPFPMSVQFTPHDTGPALMYITASAWSNQPNQLIGVTVSLDNKPLGKLMLFANEATSHKALVAMLFPVQFDDLKPHTLTFTGATPNTICDFNDIIGASLLTFSDVQPFLLNMTGPIPQYTTFQPLESGPVLLFFSGSAFRKGGGPIGLEIEIAGKPVAISQFQASTSSHQACPARFTQIMLSYSKDPVGIGFTRNSEDISSDENDFYQLALIY
jgi:hypothetical protein